MDLTIDRAENPVREREEEAGVIGEGFLEHLWLHLGEAVETKGATEQKEF